MRKRAFKVAENISHSDGRPTCYSCLRPNTHCICYLIPPFTAHCNILILQHPHERKKYYSTAKLVLRTITNSQLIRGIEFDPDVLDRVLPREEAYLLFPSETAIDCETVPLNEKSTVIIVDGTWAESRKIIRRNARLKILPTLTFKRDIRSQYRIRKQPKDYCLSTIECIGHLLNLNSLASGDNERSKRYDTLFHGFNKMVEQQLSYYPRMRKSINLENY